VVDLRTRTWQRKVIGIRHFAFVRVTRCPCFSKPQMKLWIRPPEHTRRREAKNINVYFSKSYTICCTSLQVHNQGGGTQGGRNPLKFLRPPGKMCWTYFKKFGSPSENSSPPDIPSWLHACFALSLYIEVCEYVVSSHCSGHCVAAHKGLFLARLVGSAACGAIKYHLI